MRLIIFFKKIMSKICSVEAFEQDEHRYLQISLLCGFFVVFLVSLILFDLFSAFYAYLIIDAIVLSAIVFAFFRMVHRRTYIGFTHIVIPSIIIYLLCSLLFLAKDMHDGLLALLIPILSIFLLGYRRGFLISLSSLAVILVSQLLTSKLPFIIAYDSRWLTVFTIIYSAVFLICLAVELSREAMYQKISRTKDEMEVSIQKLEEARAELRDLTNIDHLTGLYNKRFLEQNVDAYIAESREKYPYLSVLIIDIDYFKKYNDFYGHLKGDQALVSVAKVLKRCVDGLDGLLARFGGEEFVYVLGSNIPEISSILAKEILEAFQEAQLTHSKAKFGFITVSIGVATQENTDDISWTSLFDHSDSAMYQTKAAGKNNYTTVYIDKVS